MGDVHSAHQVEAETMKRLVSITAAVLSIGAAAPLPSLAHGEPNWKAVAWERNKDTPDGLR